MESSPECRDPYREQVAGGDDTETVGMREHVEMLAGTIGQRNLAHPEGYAQAERYLSSCLSSYGYQVHRQSYPVGGQSCVNLWCERPGSAEVLVVGAHYDTLDSGTPGADDNASGCAVALELARLLRSLPGGPTVRWVLFANEEPPYFQTEAMGSYVFARACQQRGEKLLGMIALESLGYYSEEPGSQHFPLGISGYPDTGNFVAFVSDLPSAPFMERCLAGFRAGSQVPAEGLAAPGTIEGVLWSDHWGFARCGFPALMITDTAPFRNPHYHARSDTPDTLDYIKLAQVTEGIKEMLLGLGR